MSTEATEKAIALIDERRDGDFDGPKEESLVLKAEAALGWKLPPSYRLFLRRLGCGDIAGFEVYGIVHDDSENSGVPDAVWLTLRERQDSALPDRLILVSADGMGNYFALDTDVIDDDGECPVVLWEPGEGVRDQEADDFGAFLLASVANAG